MRLWRQHDVFISYRRDVAGEFAQLIYHYLRARGFRPFLDVRQFAAGHLDILLQHIARSRYFLLVITPGTWERLHVADDWIRKEVERARRTERAILLIKTEHAENPQRANLPEDLQWLADLHCETYVVEQNDAPLEKLIRGFTIFDRFKAWVRAHSKVAILVATAVALTVILVRPPALPPMETETVAPHISDREAFRTVKRSLSSKLEGYDLVDVVGSFYILVEKPDHIVYRFPEWLFVFRSRTGKSLRKVKVSELRVPSLPGFDGIDDEIKDGWIAYYTVVKRPAPAFQVNFFDAHDLLRQSWGGGPPHEEGDDIDEVIPGDRWLVLGRSQIYGGDLEYSGESTVIESSSILGGFRIREALSPASSFHSSLKPLEDWIVDIERAIALIEAGGGKGQLPDKVQMGGPRVFRLYNGFHDGVRDAGLTGAYWHVPFRVGISPVLVDAQTGELYTVSDEGIWSGAASSKRFDFAPHIVVAAISLSAALLSSLFIGRRWLRGTRLPLV